MKDHTPWVIAGVIVLAICFDVVLNDGRVALFLARKGATFVEYLAFWR